MQGRQVRRQTTMESPAHLVPAYLAYLAYLALFLTVSLLATVGQDEPPRFEMCAATQPLSNLKREFILTADFNTSSTEVNVGGLKVQPSTCGCRFTRRTEDPIILVLTLERFLCAGPCSQRLVIRKDGCGFREVCCTDGERIRPEILQLAHDGEEDIQIEFITDNPGETVTADIIVNIAVSGDLAQAVVTSCGTELHGPSSGCEASTVQSSIGEPTTISGISARRDSTDTSDSTSGKADVPAAPVTASPASTPGSAKAGGDMSRLLTAVQPGTDEAGNTEGGMGVTSPLTTPRSTSPGGNKEPGDGRDQLLLGPVIGGCIGGVVFIIVLVILFATCSHSRNKKKARSKKGSSVGTDQAPMTELPPDIGYGYAKSIPSGPSSVISDGPVLRNGDVLPDVTRGVDRRSQISHVSNVNLDPEPPYSTLDGVPGERLPQEFYPGSMLELSTSRARQAPGRVQRSASYREQPISQSMGDFHFSLDPGPHRHNVTSSHHVGNHMTGVQHRQAVSELGGSRPGSEHYAPHSDTSGRRSGRGSGRGSHYAPASDISGTSQGSRALSTGSITDIQVPPPRLQRFNSLGSDRGQVSARHPGYDQLAALQGGPGRPQSRPQSQGDVPSVPPHHVHYFSLDRRMERDNRAGQGGRRQGASAHPISHRHSFNHPEPVRREPPPVPGHTSHAELRDRPPPVPQHRGYRQPPPPPTSPPPPSDPTPPPSPPPQPRPSLPTQQRHSDINSNFVLRPKPHEQFGPPRSGTAAPPPPPPPPPVPSTPAAPTPAPPSQQEIIYAKPNLSAKRNSKRNSQLTGITESEWEQVVDEQFQFIDKDLYGDLE